MKTFVQFQTIIPNLQDNYMYMMDRGRAQHTYLHVLRLVHQQAFLGILQRTYRHYKLCDRHVKIQYLFSGMHVYSSNFTFENFNITCRKCHQCQFV